MKKLSDYIEEFNIIENYIDYSILQHLAIEYKYNHLYSRNRLILERYGIYDGCESLAKYITDKILKNGLDNQYKFTKDELKGFKNIFFNNLIIDIDSSENKGGEYFDNDELTNDLLFDEVWINLYVQENHKSLILETIMHELTHAYNNYMMILKNDDNYIKTSSSLLYQNITNTNTDSNNEFFLKKALYLLLGYEQNAFFSQIKAELSKHKEKIKTPLDALQILKKSNVYKAYIRLNNEISDYMNDKLSDDEIKEIEDLYYNITNKKETANKIFKKLKALSNKTLKKLDHQLPKLCIENLHNVLVTDDTNMFKILGED